MLQDNDLELIRNDKFYELSIPIYCHSGDSVLYEIHLRDLIQNREFTRFMRFNDLKDYHQTFQRLKLELPEFPKTHFLRKTNKNPKMIQERKKQLQKYFNIMINDPFARGSKQIKKFVTHIKEGLKQNRSMSCDNTTCATSLAQSRSLPKKKDGQSEANMLKISP